MEREPATSHLDDEALSGLLDGEVAPDGGVHLAACATCGARRDELAAARAVLRDGAAAEIDELTRRRLIAAALAAAPAAGAGGGRERAWFQRRAVAGGVAAALLALLAAVPFVTGDDDRATDEAATAGAGALQAEAATDTFLGDLGELSPSTLRDRLRLAPLAGGASRSNEESAGVAAVAGSAAASADAPPQAPEALSSPAPYGGNPASETAKAAGGVDAAADALDRAAGDACLASLVAGPAAGKPLIALGVGAYQGIPAVVAAFDTGSGSEVFVTARNDCRILTHLMV